MVWVLVGIGVCILGAGALISSAIYTLSFEMHRANNLRELDKAGRHKADTVPSHWASAHDQSKPNAE